MNLSQRDVRRGERGSIAPYALAGTIVVGVIALGGAGVGRIVAAKQDAQRAADAEALAFADAIREQGIQVSSDNAKLIARKNAGSLGVALTDDPPQDDKPNMRLITGATGRSDVTVPLAAFGSNRFQPVTYARAMIGQQILMQNTIHEPKVALVLDFSGSMQGIRIATLKQGTQEILDMGIRELNINFSGALFASSLLESIEFRVDSVDRILDAMRRHEADGSTCTSCGLGAAVEFFSHRPPSEQDHYVFLISDGEPNEGGGAEGAMQKVHQLWNMNAMVYSLSIGQGRGGFMWQAAGTGPNMSEEDKERYFMDADNDDIRARMLDIFSRALCNELVPDGRPFDVKGTPTDPYPEMTVFLRTGNSEQKLNRVPQGTSPSSGAPGNYNVSQGGQITLHLQQCLQVVGRRAQLVVRYNRAKLIE